MNRLETAISFGKMLLLVKPNSTKT